MGDQEQKKGSKRAGRWLLAVVVLAVASVSGAFGVRYYLGTLAFERTDNAFIEGDVVLISPQVAGEVIEVHVQSNDDVEEGDLLVSIETEYLEAEREYRQASVALAKARKRTGENTVELVRTTTSARLQQAKAQLIEAQAGLEEALAEVVAAEAEAERAEQDFKRYDVPDARVFTQQQRDRVSASVRVARARLSKARKQVAAAEAFIEAALGRLADAKSAPQQLEVRDSEVAQYAAEVEVAEAALLQAELDLSHAKIFAPIAGRVARKSVLVGEQVRVGRVLMGIVPKEVWVVANFRETQLARMRPGQPVEIRVDAYRGTVLKGHVDSMQAGTGARFSLLPPQNATGNFVKIVQRLPVKIVFDGPLPDGMLLVPGMSVIPRVRVE